MPDPGDMIVIYRILEIAIEYRSQKMKTILVQRVYRLANKITGKYGLRQRIAEMMLVAIIISVAGKILRF